MNTNKILALYSTTALLLTANIAIAESVQIKTQKHRTPKSSVRTTTHHVTPAASHTASNLETESRHYAADHKVPHQITTDSRIVTARPNPDLTNKMYFKFDGGYHTSDIKVFNPSVDYTTLRTKTAQGFIADVALGYHLTDSTRLDLMFSAAPDSWSTTPYRAAATSVNVNNPSYSLMVNYYYDFNSGSPFRPYVTAGFGAINSGFTLDDGSAVATKLKRTTAVGYALGVGAACEIAPGNFLDIGYKAVGRMNGSSGEISEPDATKGQNSGNSLPGFLTHNVTIGFRMAF